MNLLERVQDYIARAGLLSPEGSIVVACSGGPDSLCLLHILHRVGGYNLHVAHLDHGLRPESEQEAAFVRETAVKWGLPVTVDRRDVGSLIDAGRGEEEAGRIARYRFLAEVARENGADTVVTGHTASDQAETMLMNLLRGAGPQGLAGMRPEVEFSEWDFVKVDGKLRLVRPLLEISRWETQAYCEEQGLKPRIDPTNLERKHLRSRIRHELMPELAEFQPGIEEILGRTGRVMGAVSDFLGEVVEREMSRCARSAGQGALAIDGEAFKALPQILRWELLRAAVSELVETDVEADFKTVSRASRAIVSGLEGRHDLTGGLELERVGREIVMRKRGAMVRFPEVPQVETERELEFPGRVELADQWEIRASAMDLDPRQRDRLLAGDGPWSDPRVEAIDAGSTAGELHLRTPREGDRFQPLGMQGSMTLAEFFISQGIPRLQRRKWPLITNEDEIIWVVGLRIAEPFRVRSDSQKILRLVVRPPESRAPTDAEAEAGP